MAGRDINIPFGPDRTGEFNLSSLVPEVEPAQPADAEGASSAEQPQAEPDLGSTIGFQRVSDQSLPDSAFEAAPAQAYGAPEEEQLATEAEESAHADTEKPLDNQADEVAADESDEGSPASNALGGMQASLVALKDSIGQGRELKARERERQEFGEKLDADREELTDREDILANYFALAAEQDEIINQNTIQRDARKAELSQVMADQEATSEALERMRDEHDLQLQPYETALGRAKAAAEQAKNDERSRKSELSAAETEKRRAEGGDDEGMAAARLEVVQQSYDEALARSEQAKEALDKAQKQYDELREQVEQAEAPLERTLEDLGQQAEELKESVNRLADAISAARKRRQYCDTVYQYPDETAKLREAVAADEETARRMDEENEELRELLADSKQRSRVAKFGIIGIVVIIIIIIIAVFALGGR